MICKHYKYKCEVVIVVFFKNTKKMGYGTVYPMHLSTGLRKRKRGMGGDAAKRRKIAPAPGGPRRPVLKYRSRRRTRGRYATGRVNRRKSVVDKLGNELTTRSLKMRGRRSKLSTMMNVVLQPQWYRVQGITPFDTTAGFYPIANRLDANGVVGPPVHVWDLSCIINQTGGGASFPNVGYQLIKTAATSDADVGRLQLPSIGANGGLIPANSNLISENVSSNTPNALRAAYHDWTHIKMNLYGVRARGTRWVIELVQFKHEYADPVTANGANREFKKLVDYLARPFMVSNLNSGDPLSKRYVRVIKRYSAIIDPINLDEYGGETGTPHIHNFNWFIRHNRLRRYDWIGDPDPGLSNGGQFDVESGPTSDRVQPSKRLYLLIRALSPTQRSVAANGITSVAVDPITEPSYDIVIRQKFRTAVTV